MQQYFYLNNIKLNSRCFIVLLCTILAGCGSLSHVKSQQITMPVPLVAEKSSKPYMLTKAQFLSSLEPSICKAYLLLKKTGKAPIISNEDFLQFPYGKNEPLIFCQPLHTCDIALQPGEQITGIHSGDTARWKYEVATSGLGNGTQPHLILKPTDYDIATNIIITTTRRTYHLSLVSKHNKTIKQISFWYPDDLELEWKKMKQDAHQWQQQNKEECCSEINLCGLNYNYHIYKSVFSTAPTWMPIRAFNDGFHVYIEMPSKMRCSDAPALFVIKDDGKQALVNYRVRGNYYIVDELFKQAILVTCVGSSQQRITINYKS